MSRSAKTKSKKPDFARQTATILRWLVWGAIFAMLAVMLFQTAGDDRGPDSALSAKVPQPLPESKRPRLPVDAKLLKAVKDNTPFRSAEKDAWFHLMDLLRSTPDETVRRATLGAVPWIQLFNQPDVYRGEPITLVGRVRRATRLNSPKNELGFKQYYQLWLQPRDNQDRLIVVYCIELPKDFPLGMKLDEPVVLTGFFFKRWLYEGQKDMELTSVVVARTLDWVPRPKSSDTAESISATAIVFSILIGLLFATTLVLFWHLRTRRPKRDDLPDEIVIPEELVDVRPFDEEDTEEDTEEKEEP